MLRDSKTSNSENASDTEQLVVETLQRIAFGDPDERVRYEAERLLLGWRSHGQELVYSDYVALEIIHPDLEQALSRKQERPATVAIPAGPHQIGVDYPVGQEFERPQWSAWLNGFELGVSAVTNAEYFAYVKDTNARVPLSWRSDTGIYRLRDFPVVYVDFFDAIKFCSWLTSQGRAQGWLGASEVIRLPTEFEWEAAARHPDGRWHPWGKRFDGRQCNTRANGTGGVESARSRWQHGFYHLIGNVWEWTSSTWGESGRAPDVRYPAIDPDSTSPASRKVVRGAAYYYADACSNSYTRNRAHRNDRHPAGGFRVVIARDQI